MQFIMKKWYKVEDLGGAIHSLDQTGCLTVKESNYIASFIIEYFVSKNKVVSGDILFHVFADLKYDSNYCLIMSENILELFYWYPFPFSRIRRNIKRIIK